MSGSQIESPIEEVKHWAEHGKDFDYLVDTGVHPTQLGPARRKIHYEPVGVVGAITPWNVPFYLNVAETMPALMAGNTVVLKPAQLTPWSGSEFGRIVAEETDIPGGVFNVVVSNANEVGAALSADPRVDMITFTGSTATGRAILAAGASTVKKTLLELGGKSAHIVLDDADFNSALPMAAMMACVMSGQSCILPSRILLPRSRYDEGIEILKAMMEGFPVGDPWTPGNMQGPQISETQRQKVLGLIKSGIDSGARLVTGGGVPENLPTGYYVQPTLLADVDPDSQVAQEEIFGPVLTVIPYDSDDEAIAIANNSIYGLSGEVSGGDVDRAFDGGQADADGQRHHQRQEPLRHQQPVRRHQAERAGLPQRRRGLQGVPGGEDDRHAGMSGHSSVSPCGSDARDNQLQVRAIEVCPVEMGLPRVTPSLTASISWANVSAGIVSVPPSLATSLPMHSPSDRIVSRRCASSRSRESGLRSKNSVSS